MENIKFTCKNCNVSTTVNIDTSQNNKYLVNVKKHGVLCLECYDKRNLTLRQELQSTQPLFYTKEQRARYQ